MNDVADACGRRPSVYTKSYLELLRDLLPLFSTFHPALKLQRVTFTLSVPVFCLFLFSPPRYYNILQLQQYEKFLQQRLFLRAIESSFTDANDEIMYFFEPQAALNFHL